MWWEVESAKPGIRARASLCCCDFFFSLPTRPLHVCLHSSASSVCAHIYKTYTSKARSHYQAKDKHQPTDGSLHTELSLYMYNCVSVCEEISCWKGVSARFFFVLMQGQLRTRARQQEGNFSFPMFYADICAALWRCWVESSSALFQGNSRLMQARWGPHASPLTRREMTDSELQP